MFEIYLPGGSSPVYSRSCDAHGVDGMAAVYIPPDAFTDLVWAGRTAGEWRMTALKDGAAELLGSGHWHLA